jgi:NAD(P)-dependent dehydrogenase (short-subunit alcohol dehydrogenase family)
MSVSNAVNPSDLFSASGLVVVITGGGTGLGLAMASAIVQQHAHKVYILGRRIDALTAAVKAIDHHPPASAVVVPVQCDVSDAASLQAVVRQVEKEVGRVDVLINNAGVSGVDNRPAYEASSIEELQNALLDGKPETWANTFAINSTATVQVSAAFLTLLEQGNVKRGWEPGKMVPNGPARKRHAVEGVDANDLRLSQIITISSIAAFNRLMTIGLSYIGSKAATVAMGKAMTNLFAPWGIRYNMICPGSEYLQRIFTSLFHLFNTGISIPFGNDCRHSHRILG